MSTSRLFRLSLVIPFALACASDTVSGPVRVFNHAAAQAACGPADGPAVAIFLGPNSVSPLPPSAPYVRVYVPVAVNELPGRIWGISDGNSPAAAWFHPDGSTYELATSGYLIVTSVDSHNVIRGSVDVRFPDAGRIKSVFETTLLPNNYLCG